jgi:ribosomal-protein-alanine N-acetyltransferase
MEDRPAITTDRLQIKALFREELISIHMGDLHSFNRAMGWPSSHLIEALPHFINDLLDDPSLIGWGVWLVSLRDDGMIIGDLGFKGPPDVNGEVEIAYSMSIPFRRKGYMKEAVSAAMNWAFTNGARMITAECSESNHHSKKILESVGMKMNTRKGKMTYWKVEEMEYELTRLRMNPWGDKTPRGARTEPR